MKIKLISILLAFLMVLSLLVSCGEKEQTFEEAARTLQDDMQVEVGDGYYLKYEITELNLKQTLRITFTVDAYKPEENNYVVRACLPDLCDKYSARVAELFGHIEDCCVMIVGVANGEVVAREVLFLN